jgi:hypothetical protein
MHGIPVRAIGAAVGDRQQSGTAGVPILFSVVTEATTSTYYVFQSNCPRGLKVVDVICYASGAGGAADTVTVQNGSNAITNAIDLNISDNTRAAATTLDDAYQNVEKGGTLSVVTASGAVARVLIYCVWRD